MDSLYSALIPDATVRVQAQIATVLRAFPESIVRRVAKFGGIVRALKLRERYCEVSPALQRLGIDVDGWPAPPAGLFVVEERTVYLRSRSPMTIAHEFGHAIDCALGGGVYLSGDNPEIRRAFLDARSFVTPYAATGIDEYFAESIRAFIEVNDASSHWPKATKARLQSADPAMYEIVESLLSCAT
ncbi:MAG TPA: hypothetical protein VNF68_09130 [Candidatus Baltobacteraceae bacterium]|nr:hypothetical protein [Candidatus Baltobacteraceae bacterium]